MPGTFIFGDVIRDNWLEFEVTRTSKGYEDADNGNKWVEGTPTTTTTGGVILPLSADDLKNEANGTYTTKDRKIHTTDTYKIGDVITYDGQSYKIHQDKGYNPYTDTQTYFVKGEYREEIL